MPKKLKQPVHPCTDHFSEYQHEDFPAAIWTFLLQNPDTSDAMGWIENKHYAGYAEDFLNSDTGKTYWPRTTYDQWSYLSTIEEVTHYVAEQMIRETARRTEEDPPSVTVLEALESRQLSDPRKPRQPSSTLKSRATNSRPHILASSETLGSKAKRKNAMNISGPTSDAVPSRGDATRERSPSIAMDAARGHSASLSPRTPRSIRPTLSRWRVAEESSRTKEPAWPLDQTQPSLPTPSLTEPQAQDPPPGRKHRIIHDEDGHPTPTPFESSSSRRPTKRILTSVPPSQGIDSVEAEPSRAQLADAAISAVHQRAPSPSITAAHQGLTATSEQPVANQTTLPTDLISAVGLQFRPEDLAQLPSVLLAYLAQCRDHYIHLSSSSEDEATKHKFQARSLDFRNMHDDLESRVRGLAFDAKDKPVRRTDYCLWKF